MNAERSVEAFILSGGLSRRMGSPKALVEVEGRPMIARVTAAVASVVERITLVTDRPDEVAFLQQPTIPDIYPAAGPLGGLHAALTSARSDAVLLVSCDLPFLTPDLLGHLIRHHGRQPATVPKTDRLHPVCAIYDRTLLDLAELRLRSGQRSMIGFLEAAGFEAIDIAEVEPPVSARALMNVNGPEDLAAVRGRRP